jgi:hypothetical protein
MNGSTNSFIAACIAFFGLLPGQNKLAFGREMQALNDDDRTEIWNGLKQNGIVCDAPLKRNLPVVVAAPVAVEGSVFTA